MDMTALAAPQQAELEAALRYWESEAAADGDPRTSFASVRAAECRTRLQSLRAVPVRETGC